MAAGHLDLAPPDAPVGSLMHSLGRLRQSLQGMVRKIQNSADQVRLAAGEIAQGNLDLSNRTEQTALSEPIS